MIVKVQVPLASNDTDPPVLIYAKGRKHLQMLHPVLIPRWVLDAVKKTGKAYFHAQLIGGNIVLGLQAPEQTW